MSTSQEQAPKNARRHGRKNKANNNLNGVQRTVMSENEASFQYDVMSGGSGHEKSRKRSQVHHKSHTNGNVSDNPQPPKSHATPIKQAYAGPTFHQSPAASALPLPSFFSKSVPSNQPLPITEVPAESPTLSPSQLGTPSKRESTPLDFLFDAARNARGTPRGESPAAASGTRSIPSRSPGPSPAPRDPDSMFPFELDGGSTLGEDGTPFSAPYKDRIDSVRSSRHASTGAKDLDETERRAKTDALKTFLYLNPGPKSPPAPAPSNPFNARAPHPRHHPGPPAPPNFNYRSGPPNHFPNLSQSPTREHMMSNPPPRPSSHLRYEAVSEPEPAELSSDSALSPPRVSTARHHYENHPAPYRQPSYNGPLSPPPGFQPQPHTYRPFEPPPMHPSNANMPPAHQRTKPNAQQLENDLRTVLNLNVASKG